jgi:FkbM family methyltransferase
MKTLIKRILSQFGYTIQRIQEKPVGVNYYPFTMAEALKRCVSRGIEVNTVIDVGASDSRWSQICKNYLPSANYLLIEAQEAHQISLEQFKQANKNVEYIIAAAGQRDGRIFFDNSDLFGGLASEEPFEQNSIEVPVISIDAEIKRRNMAPPYLLKLDTHGFEIPILEGAENILIHASLIIIEAYNYQLTKDSLKFYQLCQYMDEKGFCPLEMADFMVREYDNSFWQMDIFFVPKSRIEFSYTKYR